ncbi:MAG: energy transducer TonB, partial [Kiritimatiellae bacterium]|nr:energy transducer TonB [Kiritimatiellia bacterium]
AVYDADAELQNAELKLQTALDLPDLQIPDAPLQAKVDAPPLDAPLKVAYPAAARRRGDEGTVVLAFNVNMARRAENIEVVRSSGHEALDAAAKSALEKATFAIAPGHSPDTRCTIPIAFRLSR